MPVISVLMKPVSGLCNMSCDYCFYCDVANKRSQESFGFMSEQTLKNIIRKTMLRAQGAISYAYQGGEPTLRGVEFFEKAVQLQKQYNKNGIRVYNAFQTNGYHIDDKWCRFFAENHFLVGVSVDGIEKTHDAYRHDRMGNGTYERVLQATKLMDEFEVDYNILTVANRKVANHIQEIYQSYKRNGWKYQQYIACLEPLGEEHEKKEYSLPKKQYGIFLTELFEMWYEDWKRGEEPYIRQFDNYMGIIKGYQAEACDLRGICGIQNVVEADGSVYPCDFYMLDEYKIGNFNEDCLDEIDRKREENGFVEQSKKLNPGCRECRYTKLCNGGCQRHREAVPGTEYYENYLCSGFQLFFDNCYEKMAAAVRV